MKKTLFFLLLAAFVLFFEACQPKNSESSEQPRIGVAIYKFDDTFMSYVRNAIRSNASGKAMLEVVDSQNAQLIQNDQINTFLSRNFRAIAINPVDRTATGVIVQKAQSKNVPVVFFNREPLPEDMAMWDKVYYIGAKAEESGFMQGEIAYDYLKTASGWDKNGDGILQYIMLMGEPGHQDTEPRTRYSLKFLTDRNIKVQELARDTAMWDLPRAVEKMNTFLDTFGDRIEMVFCNNDDMALGVIESLKNAGFFQDGKYIPVLGVDATVPALRALEEGTLLGTVLNDSDNQGKAIFDIVFALATEANPANAGWTITDGKYIWVPYQKVTKDNYKQFLK